VKAFILRLEVTYVSCLAGFNVAMVTVPGPMGPTPFWDGVSEILNKGFYSVELIPVVSILSGLLLLADWIGPKRIPIAWLALIAAFSGAYSYTMGIRDYFGNFDNGLTLYLQSVPLWPIKDAVGVILYLLVFFFPAVVLAVIKLAGSPRFRGRFAIGASKS
jgi:hypothetical protein